MLKKRKCIYKTVFSWNSKPRDKSQIQIKSLKKMTKSTKIIQLWQ